MGFVSELRRRNVLKAAILYIVASWLILQIADVGVSLLGLPEWVGKTVFLFIALGFPLALIFSWVYELTPEGLKLEKEVDRSQSTTPDTGRKMNVLIIALLVLAIGVVVMDRLIPEKAPTIEQVEVTAAADHSIAVLPFVNVSSDSEQEYFSDGLSEELLNLLARIPELHVAARTSSFSFKGQKLEIPEIAERLKVAHVLEGSVRKSGNRVRITAQLIHAEDGYHLWSETYDRTLDDIFVIQDEIAAKVVEQLRLTLLGVAPTVQETDPETYALVLQARHLNRQRTAEGYEQSIALFQQALAISPDYAPAWTSLASVYTNQAAYALRPSDEGFRLARDAANLALAIDPVYATAHARLGWIAIAHDGDLAAAARHYERALELDPTNPGILNSAAVLFRVLGRLDEAIALREYVVAHDPVNARRYGSVGMSYLYAGRLDAAIAAYRTALMLNPESIATRNRMGTALLMKGEPEAALASIQQEPSESYRLIGLVMAYDALGQRDASDAALAELIGKYEKRAAFNIAYLLAVRGEADKAFEWLDKAVEYKDAGLFDIALVQQFANIHSDPRWLPFLESIGKSPEQLAAIEFEVTLPDQG